MKLTSKELEKPIDEIFERLEVLGKGSFGAVYKGKKRGTSEYVAMKQVILDNDLKEILKEIKIMKQCECAYVVNYYGSFYSQPYLWIIIEFCGGGSLSDLMKMCKLTLNENQIILVLRDALAGLKYIHVNRKIHRDIKAANLLLTEEGRCKLADFGVSGQLTEELSKRNTVIGTPYWMAPEVFSDIGYNHMADIWSLGITCIEMATGYPPFSDEPAMKVLFSIPKNPPPTLECSKGCKGKSFTSLFREFIAACLVKDPEKRSTATQLTQHQFLKTAVKVSEMRELVEKYLLIQAQKKNGSKESIDASSESTDFFDTFKTAKPSNDTLLFSDSTVRQNILAKNEKSNYSQDSFVGQEDSLDDDSSCGTVCCGTSDIGTINSDYQPTFLNLVDQMQTLQIGNKGEVGTAGASDKFKVSSVVPLTNAGTIDVEFLKTLTKQQLKERMDSLQKDMENEINQIKLKFSERADPIRQVISYKSSLIK